MRRFFNSFCPTKTLNWQNAFSCYQHELNLCQKRIQEQKWDAVLKAACDAIPRINQNSFNGPRDDANYLLFNFLTLQAYASLYSNVETVGEPINAVRWAIACLGDISPNYIQGKNRTSSYEYYCEKILGVYISIAEGYHERGINYETIFYINEALEFAKRYLQVAVIEVQGIYNYCSNEYTEKLFWQATRFYACRQYSFVLDKIEQILSLNWNQMQSGTFLMTTIAGQCKNLCNATIDALYDSYDIENIHKAVILKAWLEGKSTWEFQELDEQLRFCEQDDEGSTDSQDSVKPISTINFPPVI